MPSTIQTQKNTMEKMIQNSGYYVKVSIRKDGYYITSDAVSNTDGLTLYYINSHTPGEIVHMVIAFFNKLNGK